jgi:hypothetical protein
MGKGETYWMISTGSEGQSLKGEKYKRRLSTNFENSRRRSRSRKRNSKSEKSGGSLINRFDITGIITGALKYDP